MAERRCPNCGELVPSNSITCPKCYKKIPNDPEPVRDSGQSSGTGGRKTPWTPNMKIAFALDIILGLFGLNGIGQLYCGRRRGAIFLGVGLLVFVIAGLLTWVIPPFSIVLALPFYIIYVLIYLGCIFDLATGSMPIHVRMSRMSR